VRSKPISATRQSVAVLVGGVLSLALSLAPGGASRALDPSPRVDVTHADGRYKLRAEMLVAAPAEAVFRRLTDYANLAALNPSIKHSSVDSAPAPFDARVSTVVEACVPVFCRRLRRVELVRETPTRIVAEIVPELGDFRAGFAEWRLLPEDDNVRVLYRAELEPDFPVPPIVGTALVKQTITRELRALLENLERLAASAPDSP
jgi:carbon monoxide dehydrogenase subunit G